MGEDSDKDDPGTQGDKAEYQKALKHTPNNELTHLNIGDLYYQINQVQLAIENWKKASHSGLLFHLIQRRSHYLQEKSFSYQDWIDTSPLSILDHEWDTAE